jgi:hypothetical protein
LSHDSVPLPLRYFDCVLVLAFVPFGLLAGLPSAGIIVGATGWLVQRVGGAMIEAWAANHPDPRTATGIQFAGGMLRPLFLGITILAVGQWGEKKDGLMAALLVFVAFTVYLGLSIIFRPQRKSST